MEAINTVLMLPVMDRVYIELNTVCSSDARMAVISAGAAGDPRVG